MKHLDQRSIEHYLTLLNDKPVSVIQIQALDGSSTDSEAIKAFGYGKPLRIDYVGESEKNHPNAVESVVLHQITRNGFGRERDADRIAEAWLNHADFSKLPKHVHALDLVAITGDHRMIPSGNLRDLLVLTEYAPGQPYANDLIRIRDTKSCSALDVQRAESLAQYLANIHHIKHRDPLLWRRRLRDLIGHGEGIMGLTDSYPSNFAHASADDLCQIEECANRWRWRLKPLHHRLSQVHGDFHPFNVLFGDGTEFRLLDRSRGEWGEPADDVSCMSINYLFFSLQAFGELAGPFEQLYRIFWENYVAHNNDPALLRVIQPWFAWRALVLANPLWYPTQRDDVRHKLITFARNVLATNQFEWEQVNQYLT